MKRVVLLLAMLPATAVLAACGGGEVVVQAQLEGNAAAQGDSATQAEPLALQDIEVFLLPYDRDAIFDSLAAAYPEPEPAIPDSLLDLRDRLAEAQEESSRLEGRWAQMRQRLQTISDSLEALDCSAPRYTVLYADFNRLEPQVNQAQRMSEAAFQEFSQLQSRFSSNTERIRAVRAQWATNAFEPIDSIIAARLDELGREEYADTTDAAGVARLTGVSEGEWWVHARYELPFTELYWNEPITVTPGEPIRVVLRRENAEERPLF